MDDKKSLKGDSKELNPDDKGLNRIFEKNNERT